MTIQVRLPSESLVSSMRTGAKQMARLCGFILFRADWQLTLARWSSSWTRQFYTEEGNVGVARWPFQGLTLRFFFIQNGWPQRILAQNLTNLELIKIYNYISDKRTALV